MRFGRLVKESTVRLQVTWNTSTLASSRCTFMWHTVRIHDECTILPGGVIKLMRHPGRQCTFKYDNSTAICHIHIITGWLKPTVFHWYFATIFLYKMSFHSGLRLLAGGHLDLLTLFFRSLGALTPWNPRRWNPKNTANSNVLRIYRSQVVKNAVRSFWGIQLTMFEKYIHYEGKWSGFSLTECRRRTCVFYSSW